MKQREGADRGMRRSQMEEAHTLAPVVHHQKGSDKVFTSLSIAFLVWKGTVAASFGHCRAPCTVSGDKELRGDSAARVAFCQ